jgi:hypothetical protein
MCDSILYMDMKIFQNNKIMITKKRDSLYLSLLLVNLFPTITNHGFD